MAARMSLLVVLSILPACDGGTVNAHQSQPPAGGASFADAAPSRSEEAATARCSFSGWSGDPDPAGLNVRAGPSPTARIVGTLPPPEDHPDNETRFGATFDVVESRNGWFRIENARRWSQEGRGPSTLPAGWISGRHLAFQLMTDRAFAAPDPNSAVVLTSWNEDGTLIQFRYRHPTECRGEWVRLTTIGRDGGERQGWVRGICGIQETGCDGISGDLIDESEPRGWTAMD